MKLTVVGCGSSSTPALVTEIAGRTDAEISDIALVDPDRRRLTALDTDCRRILDRLGHPARLICTPELEQGADGADVVVLRVDSGGSSARRTDVTFPQEFGCLGHDTVGAGGIARALRTVPLALDIADRVRAVAADNAWLVNATGPIGVVTRALLRDKHRVLGIGGNGSRFRPWVAGRLGVSADIVDVGHLGVTQLNWTRGIVITGPNASMDVLPALLAEQADAVGAHIGLPGDLLRRTGAVPNYWAQYFYRHEDVVAAQRDQRPAAESDTALAEPTVGSAPPSSAAERAAADGVAAAELALALAGPEPTMVPVTARNSGLLSFLAQDAVVEAPALVDAAGARTLPALPLPPALVGLIGHVTAAEATTLEAAREGHRDLLADAMLAHPLITRTELADSLTAAVLAEYRDLLPWAKD